MHKQTHNEQTKANAFVCSFLFWQQGGAVNVFYKYIRTIAKKFRNFADKFPLFSCIVQQMII